jgi:DNA-binding Xre family transcriptional regulator
MIHFNLERFLFDKRMSLMEFSELAGIHYQSANNIRKRNTLKPKVLRKIESKFGKLTNYISEENHETTKEN